MKRLPFFLFGSALLLALSVSPLSAAAVVTGTLANSLPLGEGASASPVNIGFSLNFFGTTYTSLSVNESGNVTFNNPGGDSDSTAPTLTQAGYPMIAAFFADVDTTASGAVTYGNLTVNGKNAFAVDWNNVGYYYAGTNRTNTFQLLLVRGSAPGNFTIQMNYNQIQWEAGEADGGVNNGGGLGGQSAVVGYTSTGNTSGVMYELPGSSVPGSFVTGGPDSLVANSLDSNIAGQYKFVFANGALATPEPGTTALFATGLFLLVAGAKRWKLS